MSLQRAAAELGWPSPEDIISPRHDGARVLAISAQEKLRRTLRRGKAVGDIRIGLLVPEDTAESTPAPIALVCEFARSVSDDQLDAVHRFAWNYSKAPLLITVDPSSVRAWTCCEPPSQLGELVPKLGAEIASARFQFTTGQIQQQLASALHWMNLVSGRFFTRNAPRFQAEGRLDQVLLRNLKEIRQKLNEAKLPVSIAHDLLGRVIFIQFLFQRTDSSGNAALNASVLEKLSKDKVLKKSYDGLASILTSHSDTYRFFRWLNDRFNGDLFPGKSEDERTREQEWQDEIEHVKSQHLQLLSDFVDGRMYFDSGQQSLFPLYSFDTIPLEFISSIYEEFISGTDRRAAGVHYTPSHLVDLLLDGVLPWEDVDWNVKLLDPACGSGIFLVKAFQRLIHRWKVANPTRTPAATELKSILENNIFGVDINAEAVRVASFSLYLAMCDEIDPRHYWTQVRFPRLRERNLHAGDYFSIDDLRPDISKLKFDLIIGNAPWGKNTATNAAKSWATEQNWPVSYGTLGPLFLPRSVHALSETGAVSMLQPASLLTNSVKTAQAFRQQLFSTYKVEEIINLSALRFGLFANAVDPSCIITLRGVPPDGEYLSYICPKPTRSSLDDYRINIDPQDVNAISPSESASRSDVWSVLMWGSRRDLSLIRRLESCPSLDKLQLVGTVNAREGIIRGDRRKTLNKIINRRILEGGGGEGLTLELDPARLPVNRDGTVDSRASTDFTAFTLPQLIIKQAWTKPKGRFEAAIVRGKSGDQGVICSQSYLSVSAANRRLLELACAVYNSKIAVYQLLLTSGRFSSYRPEPTINDLMRVPLPAVSKKERVPRLTLDNVDEISRRYLGISDSEWALIEDVFAYTLPDFKGDAQSPGRLPTTRGGSRSADDLESYCSSLIRVLRSAFGEDKGIVCTVLTEQQNLELLPLRLVMVHLGAVDAQADIVRRTITSEELVAELAKLAGFVSPNAEQGSTILRTRVARLYTTVKNGRSQLPTVVVAKPDQLRYWTRSAGLRDGDEIAADLVRWAGSAVREAPTSVH